MGRPPLGPLQICFSATKSAVTVDGGVPGRLLEGQPDAVKSLNRISAAIEVILDRTVLG